MPGIKLVHIFAPVHVAVKVVSPPDREVVGSSRATKDSKGQDENDNLHTSTNSCCNDQVVLSKEDGFVLSNISLSKDTEDEIG